MKLDGSVGLWVRAVASILLNCLRFHVTVIGTYVNGTDIDCVHSSNVNILQMCTEVIGFGARKHTEQVPFVTRLSQRLEVEDEREKTDIHATAQCLIIFIPALTETTGERQENEYDFPPNLEMNRLNFIKTLSLPFVVIVFCSLLAANLVGVFYCEL